MSTDQEQGEDERIRAIVQEELAKQDSLTSGTVPVSRRGLLKGGAALGIGGLAGSMLSDGDSGRVAAQTAVGQVGTDTDRVDVYGNLVDAAQVSAGELNHVTGYDGTETGITYASQNTSQHPNVDTAINNAGDNDTIVILPGEHDIGDNTATVSSNITLVFYGWIRGGTSVPALEINAATHIVMRRSYRESSFPLAVYRGSPGIAYHAKVTSAGPVGVLFAAGVGHDFEQTSGANLNSSDMTVWTGECGSDGVRIINSTTNADNLNAMSIHVVQSNSATGAGVRIMDGWNQDVHVNNTEGCNRGVVVEASSQIGRRVKVLNSENHTEPDDVLLTADSSSTEIVTNHTNTVTDNGSYNELVEFGNRPKRPGYTVSTTAVDTVNLGSFGGGLITVRGFDDSDNTINFIDLVLADYQGATVINSREIGTPSSRSYGTNGDYLTLAMSSGTYQVGMSGHRLRSP